MKEIIVYDFDKTLTYKDTVLDFFSYSSKKNISYPFKLFIYFLSMICAKVGIISNSGMKEFGIRLFIKGMDRIEFAKKCKEYSQTISTNQLYHEIISKKEPFYILTASFEDYIKPLFGEVSTVLGSRVTFKDDKVYSLDVNLYKDKKIEILKKEGIDRIDIFYTDSFSDFEVARISKRIFIVRGDTIKECKNLDDFCFHFGYKSKSSLKNIKNNRVKLLFSKSK